MDWQMDILKREDRNSRNLKKLQPAVNISYPVVIFLVLVHLTFPPMSISHAKGWDPAQHQVSLMPLYCHSHATDLMDFDGQLVPRCPQLATFWPLLVFLA